MSDPVSFSLVKADKNKGQSSKEQLKLWIESLPDDITGFIACATKHLPSGEVWTNTHSAGNSVVERFEAQHIGIVEFLQFKGKKDN